MADKENKTRRLLKANFKKTDEWKRQRKKH